MGTATPGAGDSGDDGDGPLDLDNEQLTEEESSVEFFDFLELNRATHFRRFEQKHSKISEVKSRSEDKCGHHEH